MDHPLFGSKYFSLWQASYLIVYYMCVATSSQHVVVTKYLKGSRSKMVYTHIINFFLCFYCWHCYSCPHFPSSLPASTQLLVPLPSSHHHTVVWVCGLYIHADSFTFFHLVVPALHSDICQSVPCTRASVSILFVRLFCSLGSTSKWEHMLLVLFWLASFP